MNKRRLALGLAGLLVISGLGTACSSSSTSSGAADQQHEAGMEMKKPSIDANIKSTGTSATIVYTVKNFTLTEDHMSQANAHNEGHVHVIVDNVDRAKLGEEKTILLENLKPGKHTVVLSLQQNDHTPLGIKKELEIVIK
ncbi:DUF6130 family protein [Paenibacillus sp. N1-5-1-14]|uniref:DUF6130 family protein n=1 Tax=Paenibacillus radicibacter TaxID=2972488 RepID=UPI0021598C46|nr:DUF6130 family protein [Paenibacillus radicibacter]MCR8644965.1 DUF6130 family protein [Paenibacillus radicibacter]